MARTELTPVSVVLSGYNVTDNETDGIADGHSFLNTGNEFVVVRNSSGAATRDVIVKANGTTAGGADYTDETITLAISDTYVIGPFEKAPFNDASNLVYIDYDSGNESDLKIVVFKFSRAT